MLNSRRVAIFGLAVVTLTSCNRDPNVAKVRYLEGGSRYYQKGLFKQARIKYKNALQADGRYGLAYYWLGMTELKLANWTAAANNFRRAIELVKENQPEHWDALVKLSDLYLEGGGRQKVLMDEVEHYTDAIIKHDGNSFDGHRLLGHLDVNRAVMAAEALRKDEALQLLDAGVQELRRADAIKPNQPEVQVLLARTLVAKGDFVTAEQLYRKLIAQDKTLPVYMDLYKLYLIQRRYDDGEQVLKLAFQNNPAQYTYLTTLAKHYLSERRTADMVAVLDQLKGMKDIGDTNIMVGEFYLTMNDLDSALKEYKEGLAKQPKNKTAYEKKIVEVLMRQGKRAEAATLNAQILKEDPNDPDAKSLAASFLLDRGDVNRAITELQAVVTRSPDNAVALYNLGRAHFALGQYGMARQMFQKAIDLAPNNMQARLFMAQLHITTGDYQAALNTAEDILKIDRGNINARLVESAALMGQKKYSESRTLLDTMAKATPNSPDVYYQLGQVDVLENRYKEAEENFRRSYQLNPANSRGLIGIVETNMAQNKPDEAIAMLRTEADKSPNRLDLREALAKLAVRAGKYDMAIAEYRKILDALDKTSKMRAMVYLQIGETYRRKGDDVDAIASLQKAREVMPENSLVLTSLGLAFDHANRPTEARQVYEAALKMDASNGVALNNLAFLIAEHSGDLDDALTKAIKAKQLLPNMPEISDTLGWIYLKKGMSEDSIHIFQDLVAQVPKQSTYRYHLGLALAAKGDKPKAIKELQEALKDNPEPDEKQKIQEKISALSTQ